MNSLTLGFFYVAGISWAFTETAILASNGNWTPLILFLIYFLLMFSLLGCVRIPTRAVEILGGIFAALLAVGLVLIAIHTAVLGNVAAAAVKGVFAIGFCITGAFSLFDSVKTLLAKS